MGRIRRRALRSAVSPARHERYQPVTAPGTDLRPGDHLLSLMRRFRLSRRAQKVIVSVLLASAPLTAREISRRTKLAYPHAKSVVRGLIRWGILERTPAGIQFQPDPARWGRAAVSEMSDGSLSP